MSGITIHQVASAARGRRQSLGLSQSHVAARLGVSRRWMRDFEAGSGGAHFETVLRLLDLLGIDLALADDRTAMLPGQARARPRSARSMPAPSGS